MVFWSMHVHHVDKTTDPVGLGLCFLYAFVWAGVNVANRAIFVGDKVKEVTVTVSDDVHTSEDKSGGGVPKDKSEDATNTAGTSSTTSAVGDDDEAYDRESSASSDQRGGPPSVRAAAAREEGEEAPTTGYSKPLEDREGPTGYSNARGPVDADPHRVGITDGFEPNEEDANRSSSPSPSPVAATLFVAEDSSVGVEEEEAPPSLSLSAEEVEQDGPVRIQVPGILFYSPPSITVLWE